VIDERHQANDERRAKDGDRSLRELRPCPFVVIGYGNDLRGDDAVGQRVAMSVARWRHPSVMALTAHQLTPELTRWLGPAKCAIFVDASRAEDNSPCLHSRRIESSSVQLMHGHASDPHVLLALTQLAYGHCPSAWWLTIPARCFDFGADLSPSVRRGAAAALWHIRALVRLQGAT
jgi:hydrogenase maturation protease